MELQLKTNIHMLSWTAIMEEIFALLEQLIQVHPENPIIVFPMHNS